MSENPPKWALDKAADAAGYTSWDGFSKQNGDHDLDASITAHALTLEQHQSLANFIASVAEFIKAGEATK